MGLTGTRYLLSEAAVADASLNFLVPALPQADTRHLTPS
jgi:hypothetical protein